MAQGTSMSRTRAMSTAATMAAKTGRKITRYRPISLPQDQADRDTGSDSRYSKTPASRSPATERTVVMRTNIGRMAMVSWM